MSVGDSTGFSRYTAREIYIKVKMGPCLRRGDDDFFGRGDEGFLIGTTN